MSRTLEQLRAADALKRAKEIKEIEKGDKKFRSSYRSYVQRLGPSIVMNGLGQALATELAAAASGSGGSEHKAHRKLYENLRQWLCRSASEDGPGGPYANDKDLLEALTDQGQDRYILAHAEALAWLTWHKKFCAAFLPREQEGGLDGG